MASSSSSSPEYPSVLHANTTNSFRFKYSTQEEVLEDLSSRFILNLPDEELSSVERICFQIEQAHWYYEDFVREENPKFPSLSLKKFSEILFKSCPLLTQWGYDHEEAFNTFMQYKIRVPVCGAIMLNDSLDKCILVKGWKSSSGWGFPKGKINQAEEPFRCAIREVLEETGYDITDQINQEDFIELTIKEQRITLYIVGGVPEDFQFQTKTRKEISKIEWYKLADLPTWKRNKIVAGKFYLISPFVPGLKSYVNHRKYGGRKSSAVLSSHMNNSTFNAQGIEEEESPGLDDDTFVPPSRSGVIEGCSSQSSSATNGEPNTPSPRYNAKFPVYIKDNVENDLSLEGMDPHFARLLSALTVSSKSNGMNTEHTQSARLSSDSAQSATVQDASVSNNHVDKRLPEKAHSPSLPRNGINLSGSASHNSAISTLSNTDRKSNSIIPSPSLNSTHIQHTTQVVPSDRRTKQLALLELLASESPAHHAPAVVERVTQPMNIPHPGFHPHLPYAPSSSVPPIPVMGNQFVPQHSTLIQPIFPLHVSNPRPPHPPHLPPPHPFHNQPIFRPSTSVTVAPTSFQYHPLPPPDLSRFAAGNGPPLHHLSMAQSSSLPPPVNHQVIPLRVMVPPPSAMRDSGPLTAPPISPNFYSNSDPRNVNRQSLLSILNSNNSIAMDAVQPNYSSINNITNQGVSNGIMHR